MRALLLVAVAHHGSAACLLGGAVVAADTGKPIAAARVLADPRSGKAPILRRSDEQGTFCFDDLEPGKYQVMAESAGYSRLVYGARPGASSGIDLNVDGAPVGAALRLRMARSGSIEGMVVDGAGDPMDRAQVKLWNKIWDREKRSWESNSIAETESDDRGTYRFAPLPPRTYYVSAAAAEKGHSLLWQTRTLDEMGNPTASSSPLTYYGGSLTFERATAIALAPGQNAANLLVVIQSFPGRTLTARLGPGVTRNSPAWAMVNLESHHADAVFDKSGTATIFNLPPGIYELSTSNLDTEIEMNVDLTNGDAQVILEPQPQYEVRIGVVNGPVKGGLNLEAHDVRTGDAYPCRREPSGTYLCRELPGSQFRLEAATEKRYVERLFIDGRDAPEGLLDLRSGAPDKVEMVFSDSFATLQGNVMGEGVDLAIEVVWMDEFRPYDSERNNSDTADSSGKFEGVELPPGKYRLFAIEGFDDDLWGSAELAVALKDKSREVELKGGEDGKVSLPLITAAEWAEALHKVGM